jgi:hypothetical protein
MSESPNQDDDEVTVWFSIPLTGETIDRLMNLANICHADPRKVAGSLLRDVLREDLEAHQEAEPADLRQLH